MGKEYDTRSFKSGNSVAIRIPAALGIEPDRSWTIVEEDGDLVIRPKRKRTKRFNIEKVRGCAIGSGLRPLKQEDRIFSERPLLWDDPEWLARHVPEE